MHRFCGSTWQHLSILGPVVLSLRDPHLLGTVLPSFGIWAPVPIALQCLHDLSVAGLSSLLRPQHLLTETLTYCSHSDSSCQPSPPLGRVLGSAMAFLALAMVGLIQPDPQRPSFPPAPTLFWGERGEEGSRRRSCLSSSLRWGVLLHLGHAKVVSGHPLCMRSWLWPFVKLQATW